MTCPRCKERYGGKKPDYFGSDPRCAFSKAGVYSTDNWQCATMNQLRHLAGDHEWALRWGDESIGYVPLPEDEGFIVMTWHKDRGTTGTATVHLDNFPVRPMTLEDAEAALSNQNI